MTCQGNKHRNHFSILKISVFNGGSYMRQHSPVKTSSKFCQKAEKQPSMINEWTEQIYPVKLPRRCEVDPDLQESLLAPCRSHIWDFPHISLHLFLAYPSLPPPAPSLTNRVCSSWWETERIPSPTNQEENLEQSISSPWSFSILHLSNDHK